MHPETGKNKIREILGSNIRFEGHFNKCFENMKETQQEELLKWVKDCKDKKASPIQSKKNKEIIGFVKRIGSNLRAIITREKEKYFIAIYLDKHKYYEAEMESLGF